MTGENNLERYNFEQATILINLQILPPSQPGERPTLIAVGIQDEPPKADYPASNPPSISANPTTQLSLF